MEINQRIELLIGTLGYNPHSFTKTLGLKSTSTIPNIIHDTDRRPSYDVLNRIATRFPSVNMNWLLTGEGEMISTGKDHIPRVCDRVKAIMEFYSLNEGDIVRMCGCHPKDLKEVLDCKSEDQETLTMIKRAFPNISEDWFFRNEGRMFNSLVYKNDSDEPDMTGIPLYRSTSTDVGPKTGSAEAMLHISGYEDCDLAAYVSTRSMEPEINVGDILLLKAASTDNTLYGQVYAAVVKGGGHLNIIRRGSKKDTLKFDHPEGSQLEPFEIKKKDITTMYLVKGVVKKYW